MEESYPRRDGKFVRPIEPSLATVNMTLIVYFLLSCREKFKLSGAQNTRGVCVTAPHFRVMSTENQLSEQQLPTSQKL